MKRIGITGTIGSGKSALASLLAREYPVLDCDQVIKDLEQPGALGWRLILEYFGASYFKEDQSLDKVKLAAAVFESDTKRKLLEALLHPLVRQVMVAWMNQQKTEFCFVQVPLLYETAMELYFDAVVVVYAKHETIVHRLLERGLSEDQIQARMKSQMPIEEKVKRADYTIDNNGNLSVLASRVLQLLHELKKD